MRQSRDRMFIMKRYTIYSLVTVTCFVLGIVANRLFNLSSAPSPAGPLLVSLCELNRNPEKYDGEWVQIKAVLWSDLGGPYIYDWSCGAPDTYTYPLIDLRGFDRLNPELKRWAMRIGGIHGEEEILESDVIVTGLFDKSYSESSDDSDSHKFRIIPKRVEQLSPLHPRK
jgi:hypothetical protein